jgi:hypothetical protein
MFEYKLKLNILFNNVRSLKASNLDKSTSLCPSKIKDAPNTIPRYQNYGNMHKEGSNPTHIGPITFVPTMQPTPASGNREQ